MKLYLLLALCSTSAQAAFFCRVFGFFCDNVECPDVRPEGIFCKLFGIRCPGACPETLMINMLRNIVDPLKQTTPNSDLSLDLDNDGYVTMLDFGILLEYILQTNNLEDLIPGGNLTQAVLDLTASSVSGRKLSEPHAKDSHSFTDIVDRNHPDLQSGTCTTESVYNGYTRGNSPDTGPPRLPYLSSDQDFQFDPAVEPSWIDYLMFAATTDIAGLTSYSVGTTAFVGGIWQAIAANAILGKLRDYVEDNYIGSDEGIRGFRHYLLGTATTISVDYDKAVREDSGVSIAFDNEIRDAIDAARELRGALVSPFQFYNTQNRPVASTTVEWKGALGRHALWSTGTVTYNPLSCSLEVDLTIHAEDLYDFNRDDPVIGSAAREASNVFGRFTVLGWSQPFLTVATIARTERVGLPCCENNDCPDATAMACVCNICEARCPTTQVSGGRGFTTFAVDLLQTSGTFEVYYNMYGNPDQLIIYYEGQVVYTTGGLVSGKQTFNITYGSISSTSTSVTVEMTAPNFGTGWDVAVSCPPFD